MEEARVPLLAPAGNGAPVADVGPARVDRAGPSRWPHEGHDHPPDTSDASQSKDNNVGVPGGVINLIKATLGAGLLSVPKAFTLLGAVLGSTAFVGVAFLMIVTLEYGMVIPSISHGTPGTLMFTTYSAATMHWVGPRAERVLSFLLMVGMLGFEASYLDIIADVLLGAPGNPGLLSTLFARVCHCDLDSESSSACIPAAADPNPPGTPSNPLVLVSPHSGELLHASACPAWAGVLLNRGVVLGLVLGLVLLPLSLRRHMGSLSGVAAIGLAALLLFMAALAVLAGAALWQGTAHMLPLLPDLSKLGHTHARQALTAFGVLSVLLTANGCHANIHPLMCIVQPALRSRATVKRITVLSVVTCTTYYAITCVLSLLVFGDDIHEDILINLKPSVLQSLVWPWVASSIAWTVRVGYLISILASAVLTIFPFRQAVFDFTLGTAHRAHRAYAPYPSPYTDGQVPPPGMQGAGKPAPKRPPRYDDSTSLGEGPTVLTLVPGAQGLPAPVALSGGVVTRGLVDAGVGGAGAGDPEMGGPREEAAASGSVASVASSNSSDAIPRGDDKRGGGWTRDALHTPVTALLLLLAYILAISIPSIWVVVSLVGSVSATTLSFIMPALMAFGYLAHHRHHVWAGKVQEYGVRWTLDLTVVLGVLVFVNGFVGLYLGRAG